jgi:hypothetical protein
MIFLFIMCSKCDDHDIINLQGTNFQTTRQTLYQIPYFKSLSNQLDDSSYFYIFKHILAWAVDKEYPFPRKYLYEAKFYRIDPCTMNY